MDNELGARIRALRKERGLSQEALAQALEVSRQAVTKWEDGSSLPSTANLFALAGFFSVPLAELTGTPESTSPAPPAASVGPPIPEGMNYATGPVADCEAIIGYADTLTAIYVANKFPTWLFLSAVSLFAVGVGVLSGLLFKRWKGKPHDR